ncbi:MAG: hypothetical protein KAW09_08320, partial [Thermoplasmata archaeon]|nr:hypothetical protein [Thermoplasmata archaeon]
MTMTDNDRFEENEVEETLGGIVSMTGRMGFKDSNEAFVLTLKKYKSHGTMDKTLLNDAEYLLVADFCERDDSHKQSYGILKHILDGVYRKRIKTGKKLSLLQDERGRLEYIENSLGVVFDEIKSRQSKRTTMLLLCLGHLIRYEAFA